MSVGNHDGYSVRRTANQMAFFKSSNFILVRAFPKRSVGALLTSRKFTSCKITQNRFTHENDMLCDRGGRQ